MTIEQAISIIEKVDICCNQAETARNMAIEALREKAERENQEPLTLEELRQMTGYPVYMADLTGGTLWDQWIIFESSTEYGFKPRGGGWFSIENYGKTWIAYRNKAKEAERC